MKRITRFVIMSLFLSFFASNVFALENGEVSIQNEKQVAWNEESKQWLSLEEFWRDYATKNGGLTWGQSKTYPPYNDVNEYDLFMVEVKSGLCLMEFFHTRWRRANDVRRWDDKFNEYAGCKKVFD
jgi:hypothetical protein